MQKTMSNAERNKQRQVPELRPANRLSTYLARLLLPVVISTYAQALDFKKLDEALPGGLVSDLAPLFDFDHDGCLPSAGISRTGQQNGGLKVAGTITGECRSRNFLDTSNTLHRHTCTASSGTTYCGHFYALYFEKDQCTHGPGFFGICGHRHDWEWAIIWTRDNIITHGSVSSHGEVHTKAAAELAFENGHMKLVYHKDEGLGGGTHAMRFAASNERAKNPYGRFVTPTVVSWGNLSGDGLDNKKMRTLLNRFDYGKAVIPVSDSRFVDNLNSFKPRNYPRFNWVETNSLESDRFRTIPAGAFKFRNRPEIYYANGQGHYCWYRDMETLRRLWGDRPWVELSASLRDYSMVYDGPC